jgi:hypothetical protein
MNTKRHLLILAVLLSMLGTIAAAQDEAEAPTAQEILDRVNEAWQGDSFHGIVRLEITLAGATKHHALEIWTLGEELALIRILEPVEDLNSGYLQLGDDLWYYAPGIGEIKLPAIALADAVFGAGPSLEDLSHGTLSDDYDVNIGELESGWFLTLVPHLDAPVVYGKLEIWVRADFVMEQLVYYDQRGEVLQTATFSDVVEIGERVFPTTVVIEDAFGDRTVQRIENPQFDFELDPSFFSIETFESWGEAE